MEVVGVVLLEAVHRRGPDRLHRHRIPELIHRQVAGGEDAFGGLESPPVAGPTIHLCEHLGQRPQQITGVVDQHQLVVLLDRVPPHQLRQPRIRPEVVLTMTTTPGSLRDVGQLRQLRLSHLPIRQVIHISEPRQLPDIVHDVVIHHPVRVIPREQTHPTHRPDRPRTAAPARKTATATDPAASTTPRTCRPPDSAPTDSCPRSAGSRCFDQYHHVLNRGDGFLSSLHPNSQ